MSGPDSTRLDDGSTVDYWQVAFAALALIGLVLAAFAAPIAPVDAPDDSSGSDDFEPGDPEVEPGDGNGELPGVIEWLLRLLGLIEIDGQPPDTDDDPEPCQIVLDREPVPGANLTVTVLYATSPVENAAVWFDGQYVGETDDAGQVTGEVPYSDELDIRVASEELTECEEVVDATGRPSMASGAFAVSGATATSVEMATAANVEMATAANVEMVTATGVEMATTSSTAAAAASNDDEAGNVSVTRSVSGEVRIEVLDRPYPGEEVEIGAAIRGVPMREAEVSLDGEHVAETDDEGRATVEIPDDGSDQVPLTVSRGDFSGTAVVDVYLLEATLRPAGLVLVPGGEATVLAEKSDEPVADAEVTVEGERLGTTDWQGERPVVLPADPTGPVTVSTDRQTTSVSLLGIYWLPLSVLGVLTALSGGVAHRYRGLPGLLGVLGLAGALAVVVVAGGYWWPEGSILALAAFGSLGLAAGLVTYRRTVRREAVAAGGLFVHLFEALVARILWVVGFLEQLLDYVAAGLRSLLAWTRALLVRIYSLPRSVSGLLVALTGWIETLFGRAMATMRAILGDRRLAARAAGVVLLGVVAVATGYHHYGVRGAAIAVLGIVLVAVLVGFGRWASSRGSAPESTDESDEAGSAVGSVPKGPSRPTDEKGWTLRQLWRAFASRVVPGRWRTRTPVEVSRAAIQNGYPATPVSELTTIFREVEYGNRPLTAAVRDRAARAYESLMDANTAADADTTAADADTTAADADTLAEAAGSETEEGEGVESGEGAAKTEETPRGESS